MATSANHDARSRDDELLTKVLSSAYSLQQQHDRIQSKLPAARFGEILAQIINTQTLIRGRKLDVDTALSLITNRAEKLSGAAGAAIALFDGEFLDYRVGTGIAASLCGFKCPAQEITSFERLKSDSFAETDTWQEKVLGGRVVANVLSTPIYRQHTLAGCIQLFSRHGHFDLDGRYVCELMSGIVNHVIEKMPLPQTSPIQELFGARKPERGSPRDQENPADKRAQKANHQAKMEWPGSNTRELEALLKKVSMSGGVADKALKQSPGADRNPQIVSRAVPGPSASSGSLALVPSENHAPRLVANLAAGTEKIPKEKTLDEAQRRETLRDPSAAVPSGEQTDVGSSFDPANDDSRSKAWNRIKRMIYPIFVLFFAIGVRIRAGTHSWPFEIIIYILLVLTTLELQSRWSKP